MLPQAAKNKTKNVTVKMCNFAPSFLIYKL